VQDAWLAKAKLDLKVAAHEMTAPAEALWGDVIFHAQQDAEKSMKAFLRGTMCRSERRTTLRNSASNACW
jgi:HEPN domain-containing protein